MRGSQRRQRPFWFCNPTGEVVDIEDAQGRKTGAKQVVYGEMIKATGTLGIGRGKQAELLFGASAVFESTILVYDPDLPVSAESKLWVGTAPVSTDEPPTHRVTIEPARGPLTCLIPVRRLS